MIASFTQICTAKLKKKTILTIPTEMHSSDVFKVHLKTIKHEKKNSQKTTYRNVKHQVQTTDSKQHLA